MPKSRSRFPLKSRVRKFSTDAIAEAMGVNKNTARKWKSQGLPQSRIEQFKELEKSFAASSIKPPSTAQVRRLLNLDTSAIATLAGVTRGTAARWKREDRVPPKSVGRFLTGEKKAAPRALRGRRTETFSSKYMSGNVKEFDLFNSELTPDLLMKLADRLSKEARRVEGPGVRVQFIFEGVVWLPEERQEKLKGSAAYTTNKENDEAWRTELTQFSGAYKNGAAAVRDLLDILADNAEHPTEAGSIKMLVRDYS